MQTYNKLIEFTKKVTHFINFQNININKEILKYKRFL